MVKRTIAIIILAALLIGNTAHAESAADLIAEIESDELSTLAICVEAEAGNQDLLGKRLVVDVILNRVDSAAYPNSIIEVIEQRNQFTSFSNGAMDKIGEVSDSTRQAIEMELESRTDSEIIFFTAGRYSRYGKPAYKHGDHYFSKGK